MSFVRIFLITVAAVLLSALRLFGQLPATRVLTIDVAQTIAQEAMTKCRADGHKIVVSVVDNANVLKAFLRDDGTPKVLVDLVRMKLNFVIAWGLPSGPFPTPAPGAPAFPVLPDTVGLMGGVPIKADFQMIGAVAVAGAGGDIKDVNCANAGLAKVADKLK